jgi:hypothetical protein
VRDVPTITVNTGLGVVQARSFFTVMLPTLKVLVFTVATDLDTILARSVLTIMHGRCEVARHSDSGAPHGPWVPPYRVDLLHVHCKVAENGVDDRTNASPSRAIYIRNKNTVVDSRKEEANRKGKLKEANITDAAMTGAASSVFALPAVEDTGFLKQRG